MIEQLTIENLKKVRDCNQMILGIVPYEPKYPPGSKSISHQRKRKLIFLGDACFWKGIVPYEPGPTVPADNSCLMFLSTVWSPSRSK